MPIVRNSSRLSFDMKALLFLIIALGCIECAVCDEKADLATINNSQPLQNGVSTWQSRDAAVRNLYMRQLQALRSIADSGTGPDLPIAKLIPYLTYAPFQFGSEVPFVPPMEKKTWPAFRIILSRPNAAGELKVYSLDNRNPINYRIAAWQALQYVDEKAFSDVSAALWKQN